MRTKNHKCDKVVRLIVGTKKELYDTKVSIDIKGCYDYQLNYTIK